MNTNPWYFNLPVKIIFGRETLSSLTEEVKAYAGTQPVLLVTGANFVRKTGLLDRVRELLPKNKIVLYDKVVPEPDTGMIDAGIRLAKGNKCGCVIGIGGGSVLDTAKSIAGLLKEKDFVTMADYLEFEGTKALEKPGVPFIAVPTTAGTGAEVTKNAVIINRKTKSKRSLRSDFMFAKAAILDPALMLSMSPKITAESGMDAFTHILEGYIAKKSNEFTDLIALEGIRLVSQGLVKSVKEPKDIVSRETMSLASLYGGILIANAGLGLVHAVSPFLGSIFGITHGLANAVLLPYVMEYNYPACKDKFSNIARIFDGKIDLESEHKVCERVIKGIRNISQQIGIPQKLSELGIKKSDLPLLAERSLTSNSVKSNPRGIDYNQMLELLERSF